MRVRGVARRQAHDLVGLAWTVAAAVVTLAPALRPGVTLGSFDLLSRIGLTYQPGVAVHSLFPADQVLYFVPLTNLAWHQVHSGHLPLWNPYNLNGIPLAFSWQSAPFSVPALISYLFPVRYAYTVIVLAKLVIAGTGAYVLCRVIKIGALGSALGATTFELSGPMLHYSGWAMTGVTAWSGWIFAAAVLVARDPRRIRHTILLALAVAAAIYGGHPESMVVLAVSLAVFIVAFVAARSMVARGAVLRPLVGVGMAGACGVGLACPLLLPGLQVAAASGRASSPGASPYALSQATHLLVALQGSVFETPPPYIGVVAVVLAVVGVALYRRGPEILALVAVAFVALLLTFRTPLYTLLQAPSLFKSITWNRDVMLLALAVSVLAAAGTDPLVRSVKRRSWRLWAGAGFGGAGLIVLAVAASTLISGHVTASDAWSFFWPAVAVVVGLAAVIVLWVTERPDSGTTATGSGNITRYVAGSLLVIQSAFLVASGVSFWSLNSTYFAPTSAVEGLKHAIGGASVAIGPCRPTPFTPPYSTETGIRPNANVGFDVHEFAAYEPTLPRTYDRSWTAISGMPVLPVFYRVGLFCPFVTTVAEARIYGVSYVLEPPGRPGPVGAVLDADLDGERLFRIPGAASATLSTPPPPGMTLPLSASGTPVSVTHPGPASWRLVTDASGPRVLRLRLTAEPGWQATIDGHPLKLQRWAYGAMLEANIPAGHHVVELHYWPDLFTMGIVIAAGVAVALGVTSVVTSARKRRQHDTSSPFDARALGE